MTTNGGHVGHPLPHLAVSRRRGNEPLFDAQVTSVRAVVQTPEKRCWVEREQVASESRNKVPGVIAGGAVGSSVGGGGTTQEQDVQRCDTPQAQARPELWDVRYVFRGQEHRVQMTTEPGATITVNRDGELRV